MRIVIFTKGSLVWTQTEIKMFVLTTSCPASAVEHFLCNSLSSMEHTPLLFLEKQRSVYYMPVVD